MRTRKLGFTDLHLTTVGFGAASIGAGRAYGYAVRDDAESIATIHRALDLGINWIDVAPLYGRGRGEELVAEALRGLGQEVIIATKCGRRWREGEGYTSLRTESIREEVELSLRRLEREVIDLYQIHSPSPDEEIEEGWSTIADLIQEGKIRYGGVSNFKISQLMRVQAIHPVASCQPSYSMLNRSIEDEKLPYCVEHGIGVIPYSPMQSGLLTGKFTREHIENLPETDWRLRQRAFKEPSLSANLVFVDHLQRIAGQLNVPLGQIAIAWALLRPEITSVIVGARRPSQIEETGPGADLVLSDEIIDEIGTLLPEFVTS
ncbi:MAG: aldo/keto reductase [Anaerolineae bacterium]|nr:aldo/keto reductase [Anaerolineae bacterium]